MTNEKYFNSIAYQNTGYLLETPKRSKVLENAKKAGRVEILPGSNNRAVIIETEKEKILQSYDTIILTVNKLTGEIIKNSGYYSKTTLKHINYFLGFYGLQYNKKQWENISLGGVLS